MNDEVQKGRLKTGNMVFRRPLWYSRVLMILRKYLLDFKKDLNPIRQQNSLSFAALLP